MPSQPFATSTDSLELSAYAGTKARPLRINLGAGLKKIIASVFFQIDVSKSFIGFQLIFLSRNLVFFDHIGEVGHAKNYS